LTSKQSSTKNAPSKNPETLALNQSPIQTQKRDFSR